MVTMMADPPLLPNHERGEQPPGKQAPAPPHQPLPTAARQVAAPRKTDHTYHDWATHPPDDYEIRNSKKASNNFPAKLHRMLSNHEHAHAICWQPHGRAWKIKDKRALVEEVIPLYFGQSKFESFTRQLSGWGFKRLHQSGPDFHAYYHECFLRGLPHLTRIMKRPEPNQGKNLPYVDGEPNFYEMDLKYPLPAPTPAPDANGYYAPPYPNAPPPPYSWSPYNPAANAAVMNSYYDQMQPSPYPPAYGYYPPNYGMPPPPPPGQPYPHPMQQYPHPGMQQHAAPPVPYHMSSPQAAAQMSASQAAPYPYAAASQHAPQQSAIHPRQSDEEYFAQNEETALKG